MIKWFVTGPAGRWSGRLSWNDSKPKEYLHYPQWPEGIGSPHRLTPNDSPDHEVEVGWWKELIDPDLEMDEGL